MAEFVTVARVSDIPPGERIVVEHGRDWVVIFNVDGTLYALEDRCSHEDVPLSEGQLDGVIIECAQHSATFDITTGQHLSPPAFAPVRAYDVRVQDGDVQIARRAR
jgi:3-phenylpropionate/trans-cinnamate dioxygenase ferredoxin subunit